MPRNPKVKDLQELAQQLQDWKAAGKKIVLSHGVFDLLHMGHIRHLEQAKRMGDVLVVTLTEDHHVNKGPNRPSFPQDLRAEAVAALEVVDFVAINRWPRAVETIQLLRPDTYVKGQDYRVAEEDITGGITPEAEAVRGVGGQIQFTDEITFSSSNLLNTHFSPFPPETEAYLQDFRRNHSADEVISWLDKVSHLRPLVMGEAIIDEYLFCEGLGMSSKDPVLAVLQDKVECCAGGSLAVANHLAGMCGEVRLITQLGDRDRREDFVRASLKPNVDPVLLTKANAPTVHKRRIVDRYSGNKLLEIYVMDDRLSEGEEATDLEAALEKGSRDRDLILSIDYGHGLMTPAVIEQLCTGSAFLAANAQSNAGNRGFNPISKYRRADYLCLAGHELALETRMRDGEHPKQLLEVASRIACPFFTLTRGKYGSLHYDTARGWHEAPALASRIVDRVGAGDAVFAVTSLLARIGAPMDIVAFVGNAAGAQAVADMGNRSTLDHVTLSKHLTALLK